MLIIYCFPCLVYFLYDVGRNHFLSLSYDACFQDLTETHSGCHLSETNKFYEYLLSVLVVKALSEGLAPRNVHL